MNQMSNRGYNLIIMLCILLFTIISFGGCHTQIKLGYKNLKAGNWERDTSHIAFNKLPDVVADAFDEYYKIKLLEEKKRADIMNRSQGFIYQTRLSEDSIIHFVNYSDAYTLEDKWGPMGLYFKVGKKKLFMPYWKLSTPLILHEGIIYYPTDIFVDEESEKRYKYKNFIGYEQMYYVAYSLKMTPKRRL